MDETDSAAEGEYSRGDECSQSSMQSTVSSTLAAFHSFNIYGDHSMPKSLSTVVKLSIVLFLLMAIVASVNLSINI